MAVGCNGVNSRVDDDDFALLELRLHGIAFHMQREVVFAFNPVRDFVSIQNAHFLP
jgi:hypothetical protein